ncbi:MAG: hypothetical protein K6E51_01920 [Treponema sp.]|nr:hypothetical protein [Treponema sp.]
MNHTGTVTCTQLTDALNVYIMDWQISEATSVRLTFSVTIPYNNPELFIPAVYYRENNCGTGAFVQGPYQKGLYIAEDRTPLPGCLILHQAHCYTAFCLDIATCTKLSASIGIQEVDDTCQITVQLPVKELPYSYQGKTRTISPAETTTSFDCQHIQRKLYSYTKTYTTTDANTLFLFYREFTQSVLPHLKEQETVTNSYLSWDDWYSLKLAHLKYLVDSTDTYSWIRMGKNNGVLQNIYEYTGASFLVKSIEGAWIFAQNNDIDTAEKIGQFFLQAEASEKNGIYRDNYDIQNNQWGGYLGISENNTYKNLVNARCNGEAMLAYIKLYETCKKQGKDIAAFIQLPKRVAQFYVQHQLPDGNFGRWWTPAGEAVNTKGTNGAYIVSFLIALLPHVNGAEKTAIENAIHKSAEYYHHVIDQADYYGDTLDADAFDKESAAVLLRESLDMYTFTKERRYLDDSIKAAHFIYTWMWLYDIAFPKETPLAQAHYKTTGMTSVSVAHHHHDFYGMYLARDFLRLYRFTNDQFYKDNALLMMQACRQLIACPHDSLGRTSQLYGWQPEQMNYTSWDYFDRADHQKGWYDICVAWVPVLTLGAYLQILDENGSQILPE